MYTSLDCNVRCEFKDLADEYFGPEGGVQCLVDLIPCRSLWRDSGNGLQPQKALLGVCLVGRFGQRGLKVSPGGGGRQSSVPCECLERLWNPWGREG